MASCRILFCAVLVFIVGGSLRADDYVFPAGVSMVTDAVAKSSYIFTGSIDTAGFVGDPLKFGLMASVVDVFRGNIDAPAGVFVLLSDRNDELDRQLGIKKGAYIFCVNNGTGEKQGGKLHRPNFNAVGIFPATFENITLVRKLAGVDKKPQ
jgi:hypothetical protein